MKTTQLVLGILVFVFTVSLYAGDLTTETNSTGQTTAEADSNGIKLVADALTQAKKEGKHVFLKFTSQGCTWCRILDNVLNTNEEIAAELKRGYVCVVIDVSEGRNKAVDVKYGDPNRHGVPMVVVLDAEGERLIVQKNGLVEGNPDHGGEAYHISPVTVVNFLKKWAPKK